MITMMVRYGKMNADATPIPSTNSNGATMLGDTENV
jgi:hypothetical protein